MSRIEALRAYEEAFVAVVLAEGQEADCPEAFGLSATLEAELRSVASLLSQADREAVEAEAWESILSEDEWLPEPEYA